MKTIIPSVLAATTLATAVTAAQPQGAVRTAILDAARKLAVARLGKPVKFKIVTLNRDGDWAFLHATMVDTQGRAFSFVGTPLAADAREGAVSNAYVALLRRRNGAWTVIQNAIGPTDVAWEGWSAEHGAPAALFTP